MQTYRRDGLERSPGYPVVERLQGRSTIVLIELIRGNGCRFSDAFQDI